jgi:hypothetical protein
MLERGRRGGPVKVVHARPGSRNYHQATSWSPCRKTIDIVVLQEVRMIKVLSGMLSLAILASVGNAADAPLTIEDVNANPAKFVGQTLKFEKVSLQGCTTGPKRYRLILRTPAGTEFTALKKDTEGQRLVFMTGSKDENAKKFVENFKGDNSYTVTLTVLIRKERGNFLAVVKGVDSISYRDE